MTPSEALVRLESGPAGLSPSAAAARLERLGPNVLSPQRPVSALGILGAQVRSVVVWLLFAAAALALATGDVADAAAIGAVLILNTALGFFSELRARRAMEALLRLEAPRALVVRDGATHEIDARDLVPGDVILVDSGRAVPADARLLSVSELQVNEATLTGESLPAVKRAWPPMDAEAPVPERATMLYQATTVAAGAGRGVVVATGMSTELGRLGSLVATIPETRTPLERRLDALGRRLVWVSLGAGSLVVALGVARGESLGRMVQTGLALAVAAVPEGLPIVATIALAVGVRRMARRRALVRRLFAVDTLGSATLVCSDKTGTLTAGEMMVAELWIEGREIRVTGAGFDPEGAFLEDGRPLRAEGAGPLELALRVGALANRSVIEQSGGKWIPRGDPTEAALLVAARKRGLDRERMLREWPEVGEIPFSSERQLMATFHRTSERHLVACAKGAPDRLLDACDELLVAGGARRLDEAGRREVLERNHALAARGLRVLALAHGRVDRPEEAALRGLTFVGLVGMIDPPAPGVRETIRSLREAGIRTVMLTGDQQATAEAVARDLGVLADGDEALDGRELKRLSEEGLTERVARVGAFSRVSPEDKLRIVSAYQRRGEVVAMLGDGVNDAAALKKADIGVTMGIRGTDVARESATVVLQDDRFQTIAVAVEEGRVVFDNLRKFIFYLFSCNLAEVLLLLGAGLASLPLPLLPLQILWLNLVTDTLPALALAVEPGEPDVMRQPPRDPQAAILSRRMLGAIAGYGALITGAALAAFLWALSASGGEPRRAATVAFVTLGLAQIFHLGNARSRSPVTTPGLAMRNRFALAAAALAVAGLLAAVYVAPLAAALHVSPLSPRDWPVILPLAAVPALAGQTLKHVRRRSPQRAEVTTY